MKSYLSMIPISARAHRRQNRMTILCIMIAVFLVTAVFSMTDMAARQETARLVAKHGSEEVANIFASETFKSLLPVAGILFVFVLCAGILMIAGSMNSTVEQRIRLFGLMRCIGMSKKQIIRYVRLEALNWCKTAIPSGLMIGTFATWILCAVLKFGVGGEWADMPQLGISMIGIASGIIMGILTVLIAAGMPARKAARVTPVSALSGIPDEKKSVYSAAAMGGIRIEKALGIRHATESKKNLFLMVGSFALSIILFLSFSVFIDLVNCLMPQSESAADIEIYTAYNGKLIKNGLVTKLNESDGVKRAFGRRAVFDVEAECSSDSSVKTVDIISFESFDLKALRKDKMLERGSNLEKVIDGGYALVITDEDLGKGDEISVLGTRLEIAGKLKYDPFSSDGSTEGKTTLIVSDDTFKKMTGISDYTMVLIQLSKKATDENIESIKNLIGNKYNLHDYREENTHGTYVAFLVCVYSFLAIITMVTILNIVNSISMSVSTRIRQYGAMRAVGMSKKQVARMITTEALTYASLGCAAGILIGLLFTKWLYGFLVTSHFAYAVWHLPIRELLIILIFFGVSVISGIRAPIRRLDDMSITETINQL